jgi:hypothetical protein
MVSGERQTRDTLAVQTFNAVLLEPFDEHPNDNPYQYVYTARAARNRTYNFSVQLKRSIVTLMSSIQQGNVSAVVLKPQCVILCPLEKHLPVECSQDSHKGHELLLTGRCVSRKTAFREANLR